MNSVTEAAHAKVNLALHVTGRRADGYHLLDTIVAFPAIADRITLRPAARTGLSVTGPFAGGLADEADNLALRAAALLPGQPVGIALEKNLPLAAGLGGGSADAAAVLRGLARLTGAALPPRAQILALGADVPMCLTQDPARLQGIGETRAPCPPLPRAWIVLANPGCPCPTAGVFKALKTADNPPLTAMPTAWADLADLASWLRAQRNDLEPAAFALCPQARDIRDALAAQAGCAMARMTGSGATAYGLFARRAEAEAAARTLSRGNDAWWTAAAPLAA